MNKRPIILAFNRYYLPGYRAGGPIRTLVNMVSRLGDDFDFRIVTLDRDIGDSTPYPDIVHGQWMPVEGAQVLYMAPSKLSISRILQIVREIDPDVIYLNSFFDSTFTQRVLWARRLGRLPNISFVLAPRGEFSPGALVLKYLKKKVYLRFDQLVRLYNNLIWQASSELESSDILRNINYLNKRNIHTTINVAPDLASQQAATSLAEKPYLVGNNLQICFLSRISPMKNLDFALKVLAEVAAPLTFTIYGPKEDELYWTECKRLIANLPANIEVVYAGEVHPSEVRQKLAQHCLFFLPTRGENYGHVIHEALSAGLPVLISDQTPWNHVEQKGVGWAFPLTSTLPFVETIEDMHRWDQEQHTATSCRAKQYANERSLDADVLAANKNLFLNAIDLRGL